MSYNNPTIPTAGVTGFDAAIGSIQTGLSALSWLTKSFGRAWVFKEKDLEGRVKKVPKVFEGQTDGKQGEYMNVLPNDFLQAYSFIKADGPEEWSEFNRFEGSMKSRKVSVIFWVNLKSINVAKNYIFIDELKDAVEDILKINPNVLSMDAYFDERAEDVFDGYTIDDVESQYLMYPFSGMRFQLTLSYPEVC